MRCASFIILITLVLQQLVNVSSTNIENNVFDQEITLQKRVPVGEEAVAASVTEKVGSAAIKSAQGSIHISKGVAAALTGSATALGFVGGVGAHSFHYNDKKAQEILRNQNTNSGGAGSPPMKRRSLFLEKREKIPLPKIAALVGGGLASGALLGGVTHAVYVKNKENNAIINAAANRNKGGGSGGPIDPSGGGPNGEGISYQKRGKISPAVAGAIAGGTFFTGTAFGVLGHQYHEARKALANGESGYGPPPPPPFAKRSLNPPDDQNDMVKRQPVSAGTAGVVAAGSLVGGILTGSVGTTMIGDHQFLNQLRRERQSGGGGGNYPPSKRDQNEKDDDSKNQLVKRGAQSEISPHAVGAIAAASLGAGALIGSLGTAILTGPRPGFDFWGPRKRDLNEENENQFVRRNEGEKMMKIATESAKKLLSTNHGKALAGTGAVIGTAGLSGLIGNHHGHRDERRLIQQSQGFGGSGETITLKKREVANYFTKLSNKVGRKGAFAVIGGSAAAALAGGSYTVGHISGSHEQGNAMMAGGNRMMKRGLSQESTSNRKEILSKRGTISTPAKIAVGAGALLAAGHYGSLHGRLREERKINGIHSSSSMIGGGGTGNLTPMGPPMGSTEGPMMKRNLQKREISNFLKSSHGKIAAGAVGLLATAGLAGHMGSLHGRLNEERKLNGIGSSSKRGGNTMMMGGGGNGAMGPPMGAEGGPMIKREIQEKEISMIKRGKSDPQGQQNYPLLPTYDEMESNVRSAQRLEKSPSINSGEIKSAHPSPPRSPTAAAKQPSLARTHSSASSSSGHSSSFHSTGAESSGGKVIAEEANSIAKHLHGNGGKIAAIAGAGVASIAGTALLYNHFKGSKNQKRDYDIDLDNLKKKRNIVEKQDIQSLVKRGVTPGGHQLEKILMFAGAAGIAGGGFTAGYLSGKPAGTTRAAQFDAKMRNMGGAGGGMYKRAIEEANLVKRGGNAVDKAVLRATMGVGTAGLAVLGFAAGRNAGVNQGQADFYNARNRGGGMGGYYKRSLSNEVQDDSTRTTTLVKRANMPILHQALVATGVGSAALAIAVPTFHLGKMRGHKSAQRQQQAQSMQMAQMQSGGPGGPGAGGGGGSGGYGPEVMKK